MAVFLWRASTGKYQQIVTPQYDVYRWQQTALRSASNDSVEHALTGTVVASPD
jgi:hypothetical protein